jgi:NADH dehydrogenase
MTANVATKTKIVIIGGGFGGVRLAHQLSRNSRIAITLISNQPHFSYYPQLYHAATGGSRSESALQLSDLFAGSGVDVVVDEFVDLDQKQHRVTTAGKRSFQYDYLVLALGNVTNYFGIKGLEQFSYGIKTITGAEDFKKHLHRELVELKHPEANYVVVGAGPTGVELSAALDGYLKRITKLHGMKTPSYHIDLVEAAPRVLPHSAEAVSKKVERRLKALGIDVMTGATVEGESAEALKLKDQTLESKTVVWTAGVSNHPFFKTREDIFKLSDHGKVTVSDHLQAFDRIYVIGDNADTEFSGLAQTAIADANFVAKDIIRRIKHVNRPIYQPQRPISVIPVGPRWASVEYGPIHLYGIVGWLLRRAADLIAYHDIEQWPKAVSVWLKEMSRDDGCAICSPGKYKKPV